MSLLNIQLDHLRTQPGCEGASVIQNGDGSAIIVIPNVALQGWSKPTTTIRFVAPVGYPHAKPDCFWADADLLTGSGGQPQASNMTPIPGTGELLRWFSWHIAQWNPNRDSLLTYFNVIKRRLQDPR